MIYIIIILIVIIVIALINQYRKNISGQGVSFDDLEFAYSFTKRVETATKCLRIRRDNDNAETDLLLEATGEVDINSTVSAGGTLSAWIGINNGFMVTDYDQTGAHDFTQGINSRQAKIVNAGSWLGYKEYDGINDYYLTNTQWTSQIGSVYIKTGNTNNNTRYFLNQALTSGVNDTKIISLATLFGAGNKARILDFTPTINTVFSTSTLLSGTRIITYRNGLTNKKTIRVDGSNESISFSGTHTDNWFGDYVDTGFTMQKGRLLWSSGSNIGASYREYELLGFNIEHNDAESSTIEALM